MKLTSLAPVLQVTLLGIGKVSFLLTAVLLYKALPVADVGLFSILYAVAIILATISEFGLRGLLVRDVARSRDNEADKNRIIAAALKARMISILPYFFLGYLIAWLFAPDHQLLVLLLLLAAAWFDSNSMVFRGVLRAHNLILTDATIATAARIVLLTMAGYFSWTEQLTLNTFAALFAAIAVTETIVTYAIIAAKTQTSISFSSNLTQSWLLVKRATPFILVNIMGILYLRVAVLLLGIIPSESALDQVAAFNVAGRIPEGVAFLPIALINALIPYFARNSGSLPNLLPLFQKLERVIGTAGIIISVAIIVFAEPLIQLLATEDYLKYKGVFQLYGFTLTFSFLQYTYANLIIALDHEKWVARRYAFILSLNIVLSTFLIWFAGVIGAVLALVACEIAAVIADYRYLQKLGIKPGVANFDFWITAVMLFCFGAYVLLSALPPLAALAIYLVCAGAFGGYLLYQAQISHYHAKN